MKTVPSDVNGGGIAAADTNAAFKTICHDNNYCYRGRLKVMFTTTSNKTQRKDMDTSGIVAVDTEAELKVMFTTTIPGDVSGGGIVAVDTEAGLKVMFTTTIPGDVSGGGIVAVDTEAGLKVMFTTTIPGDVTGGGIVAVDTEAGLKARSGIIEVGLKVSLRFGVGDGGVSLPTLPTPTPTGQISVFCLYCIQDRLLV
ncbi:hypothetical protein J6590_070504 [Homalodisca vitripennis]|nr:hypothetical protein J6590_070504 [Homalodisca vitripennis]